MPDGRVKYVHTIARSYETPGGQREYVGAVRDVTERRRSEEALSALRSDLAHATRAMSLGVLTASIAHEVNQPLAGIVANAGTSLRMLANDPPNIEGARETAKRTLRDANRASDVVVRLRSLFGKKETSSNAVNLNEAAREVFALLSGDLQRNGIVFRAELAEDLPLVRGDRVELQQVVLNLISNASEAMREVARCGPRGFS